jgi:O-antigen/teichoic acid export membrane protein
MGSVRGELVGKILFCIAAAYVVCGAFFMFIDWPSYAWPWLVGACVLSLMSMLLLRDGGGQKR